MRKIWTTLIAALVVSVSVVVPATAVAEEKRWAGSWHFDQLGELLSSPCVPQGGAICQKRADGTFTGSYSGRHSSGERAIPWSVIFDTPGTATLTYSGSRVEGEIDFYGETNKAFGAYANSSLVPAPIVGIDGRLDLALDDEAGGALAATRLDLDVWVYGSGWVNVIDEAHSAS